MPESIPWRIVRFAGAPHTAEIPYVWGYTYLRNNDEARQQSGINLDLLTGDDDDIPYADYIQTLWTNFAKFGSVGDKNTGRLALNTGQMPLQLVLRQTPYQTLSQYPVKRS